MMQDEVDPLPDLRLETLTTEQLESINGLCKLMLALGSRYASAREFWVDRYVKIVAELIVRSLPKGAP